MIKLTKCLSLTLSKGKSKVKKIAWDIATIANIMLNLTIPLISKQLELLEPDLKDLTPVTTTQMR